MSVFIGFQGFRLVFHGSRSVFMVFQGSRLVFHGFSSLFHSFRAVLMVFKVPGWFFMVLGRF